MTRLHHRRAALLLGLLSAVGFADQPKSGKNPGVDWNAPVVAKDQTKELSDYIAAYREGAEAGDPTSQYNLGAAYRWGVGLPQDKTQAAGWIRKAADKGLLQAQHALGVMYENGEGLPQSDAEAIRWYKEAARRGDDESDARLAVLKNKKPAPASNP